MTSLNPIGQWLILGPLKGYRTYIAAIGLVALAIYHASVGELDKAIEVFLAALAAFGLRSAIAKPTAPPTAIAAMLLAILVALPTVHADDKTGPIYQLPDHELIPEKLTLAADVGEDWADKALGISEAHKLSKGKGVKIAILDTGLDLTHPVFAGKVIASRDFSGSRNGASDMQGHGTWCGSRALRVAPEAELINAKVLGDTGSGTDAAIASGIDWSAESGANVISMSLGSSAPSSRIRGAIQRAVAKGIIVVAAAGNEGPAEGTVGFPGGFPESVCVASVNSANQVSRFSSRGPRVDVAAPGESVRSALPGGKYGNLSGTSMATPQIAGIAALSAAYSRGRLKELSPEEFRELLLKTASDLPPPGRDTASGAGLARPAELLMAIGNTSPPPPTEERIEFGVGDLTPSGLEKLKKLNPRIDRITFTLKP
jgi:subtilisin